MSEKLNKPLKHNLKKRLGMIIVLFDFLALYLSFIVVGSLFNSGLLFSDAPEIEFFSINTAFSYYLLLSAFIIGRFLMKGHYTARVNWLTQMEQILGNTSFAFTVYFLTFLVTKLDFPLEVIFLNFGFALFFLMVARLVSFSIISHLPGWKLPIIIIGDKNIIINSIHAFYADGLTGYQIDTVILRDKENNLDLSFMPQNAPPVCIIKDLDDYEGFIENHKAYYYMVSLDSFRGKKRDDLIKILESYNIEYAVFPSIQRMHVHKMQPHYFFGNDIMILHKIEAIQTLTAKVIKRIFDLILSSLALPILGIICLIVFVMKKMDGSTTPLFYGGHRVGLNGKLFHCWKFCTMRKDADQILEKILNEKPEMRE